MCNFYANMKPVVLTVGLFLFGLSLHAQHARRAYADKLFQNQEFYKAISYYEDLANATTRTNKAAKQDWEVVRRAAISNQMANEFEKAEKWYGVLEHARQMNLEDLINYVDLLRYNGKKEQALSYIRQTADSLHVPWLTDYANEIQRLEDLQKDSGLVVMELAPFNSGMGDFSPSFFGEELVFASQKRNSGFVNQRYSRDNSFFLDCYIAEKDGNSGWKKQTDLLNRNFKSKAHDGPVSFNAEGNVAFITRNAVGKKKGKSRVYLKLYISTRNEKGKWSTPEEFLYNTKDNSFSVGHATLSQDGNTLYFASDMPGGFGGVDIWKCEKSLSNWGEPVNLGPQINTSRNELFPFISASGDLYFASNGQVGYGGLDVFVSSSVNGAFASPENMGYPINTNRDDFGLIVGEDDINGFVSSNRLENTDHIYAITINRPVFKLKGVTVLDDGKSTPLPFTEMEFINLTTGDTSRYTTDSLGQFEEMLSRNQEYLVKTAKELYIFHPAEKVSTYRVYESKTFFRELVLEPTTIDFSARVVSKKSGKILRNAKVVVTDKGTQETWEMVTDSAGMVQMTIARKHQFSIEGSKKGYISDADTFSTSDKTEATKELQLNLDRIEEGDVFAVKDIFYDYNKWNLRDTSKTELNKLAKFLLENSHIKIELSSHTDSRGTDSYNQQLSQKRAQSCVDYLISQGVDKRNIVAKGYGESKPVNGCINGVECTEEEYQLNRRTEIRILRIKTSEEDEE